MAIQLIAVKTATRIEQFPSILPMHRNTTSQLGTAQCAIPEVLSAPQDILISPNTPEQINKRFLRNEQILSRKRNSAERMGRMPIPRPIPLLRWRECTHQHKGPLTDP